MSPNLISDDTEGKVIENVDLTICSTLMNSPFEIILECSCSKYEQPKFWLSILLVQYKRIDQEIQKGN